MPWPRFPARCEVCRAWPSRPVCAACVADHGDAAAGIAGRCALCALPLALDLHRHLARVQPGASAAPVESGQRENGKAGGARETAGPPDAPTADRRATVCGACLLRPPPLNACFSALPYAFPWDALVGRFKFGDEPALAGPLAGLMRAQPTLMAALAGADRVLPLPLAAGRLAERGYNQALELARRLVPRRQLATGLLQRVRETAPQSALPLSERAGNLRQAFMVPAGQAATIRGRRLVLVDDVMTSGATLHEAARALRRAGAASVSAVVLARTDRP